MEKKKNRTLLIQEGQYSISIPLEKEKKATIEDLAYIVQHLRTAESQGFTLKEGWKIYHI